MWSNLSGTYAGANYPCRLSETTVVICESQCENVKRKGGIIMTRTYVIKNQIEVTVTPKKKEDKNKVLTAYTRMLKKGRSKTNK